MKRVHVHVSVDDLDKSIRFHSGLSGAERAVVKTDYLKWMLEDPRVNFAISYRGAGNGLNHLGIQVESAAGLDEMQSRLTSLQPDVEKEEEVRCWNARSDKYWVTDPSGIAWETFHTLDSIPVFGAPDKTEANRAACCEPSAGPRMQPSADGPCCAPSTPAREGSTCCERRE